MCDRNFIEKMKSIISLPINPIDLKFGSCKQLDEYINSNEEAFYRFCIKQIVENSR